MIRLVLILIFTGFFTPTAFASTAGEVGPSKSKAAPKDWKKETEASCGMACRYHRANDNLTMQALYLVTKIKKIDEAEKSGQSTQVEEAKISMGGFCRSGEDISDCFPRYKSFQRVALLQIREAIGKNEDVIAKLTTGRKSDGTVDGTAVTFEANVERQPYIPDVPTVSEMEQAYLEGKLKTPKSKFTGREIQKWSEELVLSNPKSRYLEFEKESVEGNPYQKEKSGYSLFRVKGAGSGTEKIDPKAEGLSNAALKEVEKVAKDKNFDTDAKAISPKDLKKEDPLSYAAFIQARSVVNSAVQKDVDKPDKAEKSRSPAAKKDPKASPSGSPSPVPSPGPSILPSAGNQNVGASEDVKVVARKPSASTYREYQPEERIVRPEGMKNSRYIKYNIHELMNDIDTSTR
jgi:hypothetical protein